MKKLFLMACLMCLVAPYGVLATNNNQNNNNQNNNNHKRGAAPEMPVVGLGAAAAIGVAGYLVLRRRHAHQN